MLTITYTLYYQNFIFLNNTIAYNANGLYPHKTQISNNSNEWKRNSCFHGYSFEENANEFDALLYTDRAIS